MTEEALKPYIFRQDKNSRSMGTKRVIVNIPGVSKMDRDYVMNGTCLELTLFFCLNKKTLLIDEVKIIVYYDGPNKDKLPSEFVDGLPKQGYNYGDVYRPNICKTIPIQNANLPEEIYSLTSYALQMLKENKIINKIPTPSQLMDFILAVDDHIINNDCLSTSGTHIYLNGEIITL